jgi:hypothetical protein
MAKLTLTPTAAGYALITTINANNTLIEAALENTLSRDGTTPNTMSVAFDMNSQAINNLPDASAQQSPVTLAQLQAYATASLTNVAASVVSITDTANNFVGTTLEAVLAELFTGNFTATGTWAFEDLVIQEVGGAADQIAIGHDGTDVNITPTTTTDINFRAGLGLRFYGPGDTNSLQMAHNDSAFVIDGNLINGIRCGDSIWMYKSGANQSVHWSNSTLNGDYSLQNNDTDFLLRSTSMTGVFRSDFPIMILEAAADNADQATYGQLWVSNALTNQQFMFTDENGERFVAAGVNVFEVNTTASFADITHSVNTNARKVQGFMAYNTTTDNPVWAVGSAAGDVWVGADGATLHTPV